jgi:hypothetical protein
MPDVAPVTSARCPSRLFCCMVDIAPPELVCILEMIEDDRRG